MRGWLLGVFALCAAPVGAQAPRDAPSDLAQRTAAVEDVGSIREIKRLQAQWGYRLIAGNFKGMAALGTDYLELVLPGGNAEGGPAVETWLRDRFGRGQDRIAAGRLNLHVYMSPVITLSAMGDRALGRWHHLTMEGEKGGSAEWRSTIELIEYHKTTTGWRIAHITPTLSFRSPYADGWRHDPTTLQRPAFHYTPDEAGTVLTGRTDAAPRPPAELNREATLLLEHGTAQNLANAYGYYLDRGMYDDIGELFAPDGQIDVAGQGVYNGAPGVQKFLGRYGPAGLQEGELNEHPLLMPLVSIAADGSMALVRVVELGMMGQHGGEGVWSAAIDTFLLRPDVRGHWRIAMLHQRPLMRADYKRGWAAPLSAQMPIGESLFHDGPGQPVDTSYPDHPFAMQELGDELVFAPRGAAQPLRITANALQMAEAFDGAENVANAYGYYIDQNAWRDAAALFAEQGWKELSYIGTFIGRDRVRDSMIQRYGEAPAGLATQTLHQKVQPYISVSGDGARVQLRERLFQMNSALVASGADNAGSMILGIYEDQVIKENGVWKLAGMDLDYTVLANYAGGWTAADPAASRRFAPSAEQVAQFRPDAPLRGETFAPYPRVAPLGFHYANPVSGREPPLRLRWSDGRQR